MACNEFAAIDEQARERFGDVRLWIAHAIGDLAVGEVAVAVAAQPHIAPRHSMPAAYAIDELKQRAPIWKKERYADGEAQWRANDA